MTQSPLDQVEYRSQPHPRRLQSSHCDMKALVKLKPEPGLWLRDMPIPRIGDDEVLIRVRKTGICGTDLHIYRWDEWAERTIPVPMIIGHEFAGEIVEVGREVRKLRVGQRVSGEGHVIGMRGRASRSGRYHLDPDVKGLGVNIPGAFATYVKLPAFNVIPLPDAIDDELGAILDPLGNAFHAALSFNLLGEDVLVTGAGPIGIMAAAVARHAGARHVVITDLNATRLQLAAQVVDAMPVDVRREDLKSVMGRLGVQEGFDVGLEMSGSPAAFEQLVDHLTMGGKISMLGIPAQPFTVDWARIVLRMLTIKGIYGREMFDTWHKMLAALQTNLNIRGVITHRMGAADFPAGFELMAKGACGKVVLDWN